MKFQNVTGSINSVNLSKYDELIKFYVNQVKKVDGVKSIIQMGSFTTPGLSDIDIIVIVDDISPPKWDDISMLQLLKSMEGFEVIAHDIFIYPESLSKYIEALYYVDRKIILYGDGIGGLLAEKEIQDLKLHLSFEHTTHSLEALVNLTSLPSVNIRQILLFFSTLRHTYRLLQSFNLISKKDCKLKVQQIELLRTNSLDNKSDKFKLELNEMIIPSFMALFESIILLGNQLNYKNFTQDNNWILNYRKLIYNFDKTNNALDFFVRNDKFNKFFKGRILIQPFPNIIQNYIVTYLNYSKNVFEEEECLMKLRYNLVMKHKEFIITNNYPVSGSYLIIENKKGNIQARIKKIFLTLLSKSNLLE